MTSAADYQEPDLAPLVSPSWTISTAYPAEQRNHYVCNGIRGQREARLGIFGIALELHEVDLYEERKMFLGSCFFWGWGKPDGMHDTTQYHLMTRPFLGFMSL